MVKKQSLTIGVPVRNESRALKKFMKSMNDSVNFLPEEVDVELIVCINGSNDGSAEIAEQLVKHYRGSRMNLSVVHSPEGKMEAQRAILMARRFQGMTAFFDADVLVHRNCLPELWTAIHADDQLQVAYARVMPFNHGYETIVEWIESVHYAFPHFLTPRKYFHGRGYFIRSPELYFLRAGERKRVADLDKKRFHLWMRLYAGPLVDDIHLSRVLVYLYGTEAIKEVSSAALNFTAPRTLRDFYRGQRRLLIELRRLDTMFPEHAHLTKEFSRKLDRKHLRQVSWDVRLHHLLYRAMEKGTQALVKVEMFFHACLFRPAQNMWAELESTKDLTRSGENNGEDSGS